MGKIQQWQQGVKREEELTNNGRVGGGNARNGRAAQGQTVERSSEGFPACLPYYTDQPTKQFQLIYSLYNLKYYLLNKRKIFFFSRKCFSNFHHEIFFLS